MKRRPARKASTEARFRSEAYLAWVRSLPCSLCGQGPSEAHHLIGMWGLSGMGMTAPDHYAMPLCRTHHDAVHRDPVLQGCQPQWLRWTISRAITEFRGEPNIEAVLVEAMDFIDQQEGL